MPLNIDTAIIENSAAPILHSPACPGRDVIHIDDHGNRSVYGANDLWDAIHDHPQYHELIGPDAPEHRGDYLLDIIAEQVFPMCQTCKSNVIKDVFFAIATEGAVMTAQSARHANVGHPVIIAITAAPEGLWMENTRDEGDDRFFHHRVANFCVHSVVEADGTQFRFVEAHSADDRILNEKTASGRCLDAEHDAWKCPGHDATSA